MVSPTVPKLISLCVHLGRQSKKKSEPENPITGIYSSVFYLPLQVNDHGDGQEDDASNTICYLKEEEIEKATVFHVPDAVVEERQPGRAEASLPKNLVLRPSHALSDVS